MGTSTNKPTGKPGRTTNKSGNIKPAPSTHSNHTSTTETESTSTRREPDRSQPTTSTGAETQELPRPFVVEPPPPGTEPKQKRHRPSGMTYNKSGDKPTPKGKAPSAGATTTVMVQSVIQGLFLIGAGRMGAHWVLTDEEAEAIAVPTANIIAKYIDTDKMAKYSDPAALVFALGAVAIPRVMIQISQQPKKEVKVHAPIAEPARQPRASVPDVGNSKPDGGENSGEPVRYAGDPAKANVEQLLAIANSAAY